MPIFDILLYAEEKLEAVSHHCERIAIIISKRSDSFTDMISNLDQG